SRARTGEHPGAAPWPATLPIPGPAATRRRDSRGTPMFTRLRLMDFKSFKDTTFSLDAFTLLIGSNASGKSNVRDALRILHGVGRGYSVVEILGEKWAEGGV